MALSIKHNVVGKKRGYSPHKLTSSQCQSTPFLQTLFHNIDRILVVVLTLLGMILSGLLADLVVILAVILWLWLPELDNRLSHSRKVHRLIVLCMVVGIVILALSIRR